MIHNPLTGPDVPLTQLAQIIQLAIAPVFLLAGIGAFLNVCVGRLARVIDRARTVEGKILVSRGQEHDWLIEEIKVLDQRIKVVNWAIFQTVLAALLISTVVILLFTAFLTGYRYGTAIAVLFIVAMVCTSLGFALFLYETRLGTSIIRVRNHIIEHTAEED